MSAARYHADHDREYDLLRGMCPEPGCNGWGCKVCDWTGFHGDGRSIPGRGLRRLLFWPWHYVQHVRRGHPNGWYSRLFCTFCVDDRLAAWAARLEVETPR